MSKDFAPLAEHIVDELLTSDPELSFWTGDHRTDGELPDFSDSAVRSRTAMLREASDALAEIDPDTLAVDDGVDLDLLSSFVDSRLFALTELREHEWNPLVHNPGFLLNGLLTRPTAPLDVRMAALTARLAALPEALRTANQILSDCPTIHVETALTQLAGTESLIRTLTGDQVADSVRAAALTSIETHREVLRGLLDRPGRDPRLGRRLWEAKLWHTLDSELSAAELLRRAEDRLASLSDEIESTAAELTGTRDVRAALDRLAADHPDATTIVGLARTALAEATAFVAEHDLVGGVDDVCDVVEMPEFARGVAVAYCDGPGPLETAAVPTVYAIAPPPSEWDEERVASYYREYNTHQLRNLTVHEAMPGHFLQLARARRYRGSTRVRALCSSGSFIEGWAVYAEEMMAEAGFGGAAVRMQQLKMQLRMTINAMLDQLVHCEGLSEVDGLALMTQRGFQEDGEAAGKWRRARLTSGQLSTYFVGYTEVAEIARARPTGVTPREWHDRMLAHGSPSPRHLARLLELGTAQ